MTIQIFGLKKCHNTQKALRFFKEQNIPVHFVDLKEKGISPGELKNIVRSISLEDLIDKEGREYRKSNLEYMEYNAEEELLENPLLFKTPVVRSGKRATAGYEPETWKKWLEA